MREYIKRRYPELSEEEVEEWAVSIEKQRKDKATQEQSKFGNALFDDRDMYGNYETANQGGDLVDE